MKGKLNIHYNDDGDYLEIFTKTGGQVMEKLLRRALLYLKTKKQMKL